MQGTIVARATAGAYGAAGLFAAFFLLLGGVATYENRGSWPVLAIAGGVTIVMLANLAYLRLAVGPDGIGYRILRTHRKLKFSDIKRAYLETSVNRFAPHGVVSFWIQPNEGKLLNINLRIFPVEAVAALLAALEQHGVPFEVPATWAGQRMAREIRGLGRLGPRRT
jgi:hypothetical protein